MKKLSLIVLLLLILQFKAFSQEIINNYKYVIVPTSYSFLNEVDKYQLNSLTKFLFNKYGYTAFLQTDDLPQDLKDNRCLGMYADVIEDKGLFKTKLRIDLKDCGGNLIMSSQVGETREKEYAKAFNIALRGAFETYQNLDYKYVPSKSSATKTVENPVKSESTLEKEKEIELLKAEVKSLKEEKEMKAEVVETPKVEIEQPQVMKEPEVKVKETKVEFVEEAKDVLYAQPIQNGFQVVDTTPKIVMVLLETPQSNVFIVKDQNAMVYLENGSWFISKNEDGKVTVEALNIKF